MSDRRPSNRIGIEERTTSRGETQYRGTAYCKWTERKLRGPWSPTLAAARAWRVDALARLQAGTLSGDRGPRIGETVDDFLVGVEAETILNRKGQPYKPSACRGMRTSLTRWVVHLGPAFYLAELELDRLQRFVDERTAEAAASTVANDVNSLRSLFAWARRRNRSLFGRDPFKGVLLPTGEQARDRIASPEEMGKLIAALALGDRALLALAGWAGLRRGEALALAREHVDLDARLIHVGRAWDPGSGRFVAPKSKRASRSVPIVARLMVVLREHPAAMSPGQALLFPGMRGADASERPMNEGAFTDRARKHWAAAGLAPIGLHEARHTYASIAIAANVNPKALSVYMGHAGIQITFDRYGHLMPGNEAAALALLDAYLAA
jgi:integrase